MVTFENQPKRKPVGAHGTLLRDLGAIVAGGGGGRGGDQATKKGGGRGGDKFRRCSCRFIGVRKRGRRPAGENRGARGRPRVFGNFPLPPAVVWGARRWTVRDRDNHRKSFGNKCPI